jgi:hypothetical protein
MAMRNENDGEWKIDNGEFSEADLKSYSAIVHSQLSIIHLFIFPPSFIVKI